MTRHLKEYPSLTSTQPKTQIAYIVDAYQNEKSGGVITANRFIQQLKPTYDLHILSTCKPHDADAEQVAGFYPPFFKKIMKKNGVTFGFPSSSKIKAICRRADLVYIHFPFLMGLKAIKIAKAMNKPVVVGFHVQPENMLMNMGIRGQKAIDFLYRTFIKKFYNLADYVICPSQFAETLLHESPYFRGRTVVISNGITDRFKPCYQHVVPHHKEDFTILTVGRLAKEKRHALIIDAIKHSAFKDQIKLIITGDGVLKSHLTDLSRDLPIPPHIGFVNSTTLLTHYQTADLFIQASQIELEGMSVLEAIACGCPALISDAKTSASKQFALDDRFLFKSNNREALTQKLDYWISHKEALREARKAYALSAKPYHIAQSTQKMIEVFEQAIKNKTQAALEA